MLDLLAISSLVNSRGHFYLSAILTQARGGALPMVAQQKARDWCKHGPSFA
jgi:hypothetical protein